jgi:hypothetical protein
MRALPATESFCVGVLVPIARLPPTKLFEFAYTLHEFTVSLYPSAPNTPVRLPNTAKLPDASGTVDRTPEPEVETSVSFSLIVVVPIPTLPEELHKPVLPPKYALLATVKLVVDAKEAKKLVVDAVIAAKSVEVPASVKKRVVVAFVVKKLVEVALVVERLVEVAKDAERLVVVALTVKILVELALVITEVVA